MAKLSDRRIKMSKTKEEFMRQFREKLEATYDYGKINYLEALMKCENCGLATIMVGKESMVHKLSFGTLCVHCAFEIANRESDNEQKES
jgi:hypothetical protein